MLVTLRGQKIRSMSESARARTVCDGLVCRRLFKKSTIASVAYLFAHFSFVRLEGGGVKRPIFFFSPFVYAIQLS